jgi:hypothetical protein
VFSLRTNPVDECELLFFRMQKVVILGIAGEFWNSQPCGLLIAISATKGPPKPVSVGEHHVAP